ncbi:hypothetical protein DFA_02103 [Cavenderia fasciculata]|uniref:Uncharacterized protein n=1 Tax=Cavenderia fasciculata TaxID=261658 RepID=F4PYQ0_CACFS|nr:uncharacterized protein DFA_02103 [Cavenderia fasciculata]EGG19316.1 hypothetical protein DFA_02103 [Cavenderia fasciculata]|eukprot:XP_004357587.1 hypothetical protein DFA_02103 [Cavenderia fasciculata]
MLWFKIHVQDPSKADIQDHDEKMLYKLVLCGSLTGGTACPVNKICYAGVCVDCVSNSNCPPGRVCQSNTCVVHCIVPIDCGSSQACINNRCVNFSNCTTDPQCNTAYGINTHCENEKCVCDDGFYGLTEGLFGTGCANKYPTISSIQQDQDNYTILSLNGDFSPNVLSTNLNITVNNTIPCTPIFVSKPLINCTLQNRPTPGNATLQIKVSNSTGVGNIAIANYPEPICNYTILQKQCQQDTNNCTAGNGYCNEIGQCICHPKYDPKSNCSLQSNEQGPSIIFYQGCDNIDSSSINTQLCNQTVYLGECTPLNLCGGSTPINQWIIVVNSNNTNLGIQYYDNENCTTTPCGNQQEIKEEKCDTCLENTNMYCKFEIIPTSTSTSTGSTTSTTTASTTGSTTTTTTTTTTMTTGTPTSGESPTPSDSTSIISNQLNFTYSLLLLVRYSSKCIVFLSKLSSIFCIQLYPVP